MTDLEFIEKEIDTYKQLKEQAILRIPDEDDEIQLHLLQRRINTINERLPILQQIKCELEAWEVVKWSISKEHLEDSQIRTMFGENPFMNITEKEKLIVKKALEVGE